MLNPVSKVLPFRSLPSTIRPSGHYAMPFPMKLISGTAHRALAERIAENLGQPLADVQVTAFPDGETFVKIDENILFPCDGTKPLGWTEHIAHNGLDYVRCFGPERSDELWSM